MSDPEPDAVFRERLLCEVAEEDRDRAVEAKGIGELLEIQRLKLRLRALKMWMWLKGRRKRR